MRCNICDYGEGAVDSLYNTFTANYPKHTRVRMRAGYSEPVCDVCWHAGYVSLDNIDDVLEEIEEGVDCASPELPSKEK